MKSKKIKVLTKEDLVNEANRNNKNRKSEKDVSIRRTNFSHDDLPTDRRRPFILDGSQAEKIYFKFGGANQLTKALNEAGFKVNSSTVYRWSYSRLENGTGGLIPIKWVHRIEKAARLWGVLLTAHDWDPRTDRPKEEY